jgi:Alginate export
MMTRRVCEFVLLATLVCPAVARAQDAPEPQSPQKQPEEARSTGLPGRIQWTFNFDAGWGTFGFANSLYNNTHDPGVLENLSDQWFEGYVKPALSWSYALPTSGELYGKISAVGERTYGSVPPAFGEDVSSFGPEDLSIGWRSGQSLTSGENAVDVTIGRAPFQLGHGFLVYDGASEGGARGGYWTNARKAFEFAAIGRLQPGAHKVETFYLDRDELPDSDTGSRLWGLNYEFTAGKDKSTTLGATYMKWAAHRELKPNRDGLDVFNLRAYTSPIATAPDLSLEFEYASEHNGVDADVPAVKANAWTVQAAYEFTQEPWKPKIYYRFAFFQGDNPETADNEAFDPLFLGFSDWGSWWQGEIAGEYFLSNSNLKSHLIRAHFTPSESVGTGLLFFRFLLDQPMTYGSNVTSPDAATEIDSYTDWKLNPAFTVSMVAAYANPGKAVQQSSGRTKDFAYGMVYVAYAF